MGYSSPLPPLAKNAKFTSIYSCIEHILETYVPAKSIRKSSICQIRIGIFGSGCKMHSVAIDRRRSYELFTIIIIRVSGNARPRHRTWLISAKQMHFVSKSGRRATPLEPECYSRIFFIRSVVAQHYINYCSIYKKKKRILVTRIEFERKTNKSLYIVS